MGKVKQSQLSTKEKREFYLQELLGDYRYLNKFLFGLVFLIFLGNMARDRVSEAKVESLMPSNKQVVFMLLSLGGVCLFTFSSLRCFDRITKSSLAARLIAAGIGNLMIGASIVWNIYYTVLGYLELDDENTWVNMVYIIMDGMVTVIVNDIINPIWYMKIVMPSSFCIGVALAAYHSNNIQTIGVTLFLVTEPIYFTLVYFFKEFFRWKLFIKKLEEERWNEVQKVILNNVPNLITVVNSESKMIYSNSEFQKMLQGEDLVSFFRKITNIKQGVGSLGTFLFNYCLDQSARQYEESNLNSLLSNRGENSMQTLEKEIQIQDLSKLLASAIDALNKGTINSCSHLRFYGKYQNTETQVNKSYEIILTPMIEHKNIIFILNDTTQRDLIVTLENNNQYKDKLLASVSHELRTPLNANLSFIEAALRSDEVSPEIKQTMLTPAFRSGKLLGFLVNDILDFCQMGVNKLRLSWKNQSIHETIRNCYQLIELQVKAKKLEFVLDIDPSIPENFTTDHDRVGQIILNLLSNALKFTFEGKICLTARSDGPKIVEITVKDTGIGIKDDDQKKIFHEFVSLGEESGYTNNSKGVGLGLTISDSLVKMLNPTKKQGIRMESEYKKGSSFSFIIEDDTQQALMNSSKLSKFASPPLRAKKPMTITNHELTFDSMLDIEGFPLKTPIEMNEQKNLPYSFKAQEACLSPKGELVPLKTKDPDSEEERERILIVDDDPFNIWALQALFKKVEVDIDSAFNGKEAIDQVVSRGGCYRMIFMDCQMPVMDGFTATRKLCQLIQDGEIEALPIIGCTAFSDQNNLEACYQSGMTDILNKPISSNKVTELCERYLNKG